MPEGPEVRMNRDMLAETIEGKTLYSIKAVSGKLERKGIPGAVGFQLDLPSTVVSVDVKGKQLLIRLANKNAILSTLGMSGWWYPHERVLEPNVFDNNAYSNGKIVKVGAVIEQAYRYSRVELCDEEGPLAVFCDMRNFGNMTCLTKAQLETDNPHDKLGVDFLDAPHDNLAWWSDLRNTMSKSRLKKQIGELLLDQEFACGLGNIYRAEVLYIAGVNPSRLVEGLTSIEWDKIGWAAPRVLKIAYETQGVMCYDAEFLFQAFGFHLPPDYKYTRHLAYGRRLDFKGRQIVAATIGGRTMWYCPETQK